MVSESLPYLMVDASNITSSGKLSISSNNTESSIANIDFSKIETISGSGVLYQSYPRNINDTITVKNPSDAIIISMFGNNVSNYAIDTDAMIDTSLDGIPDNDSDNKDDASYTDGSPYVIYNIGNNNKREHTLRLALIKDGVVVSTRPITIILDYISSTAEDNIDLS